MSFEWPILPLEECLDALIDYRGKTPEKTKSGIPLVTAKIIKGGRIEKASEFISKDGYDTWMRRGIPQAGDVVMTTEAPLGEVAQLGKEKIALAQRVVTLRVKSGLLDSTYLLYLLQTQEMQDQLKARATGTTVLGIKQSELRKISVMLPPIGLQRNSASVLAAIDARIDLLRETNTTLETIAQALFKSWFVDFDPVHAKQQNVGRVSASVTRQDVHTAEAVDVGLPLRPNPTYEIPPEIAVLFPDSFEESELGLVPTGWQPQRLETLMELSYGKALKANDRVTGEVPVYGSGGITGYHNESLVIGPSIIVGRKGTVGSLYWEDQPFFPIDTVFYVRSLVPMTYCFYLLQTLALTEMNTDAAVPGLNRNNVYRLMVPSASESVMSAFDDITSVIRSAIFRNNQQAQTLATLRDTLLPRLISGQLRLPEAEALIGDVA